MKYVAHATIYCVSDLFFRLESEPADDPNVLVMSFRFWFKFGFSFSLRLDKPMIPMCP